jgi:hypothetical protein
MATGYSVCEMDPMVEIRDEQWSPHLPQLLAHFFWGKVFSSEKKTAFPLILTGT